MKFLLNKLSDNELIDEYINNKNNKAFDEIFKRYFEDTYRFVYSRTNNTSLTEDIVSETFISLLELIHTFKRQSQLKTFIFGISWNKIRHSWRDKAHLNETFLYDEEHLIDKSTIEENNITPLINGIDYDLNTILNKLSKKYKEVLELRYIKGQSFDEIAIQLNLTTNNTRVLCHRALKKAAYIGNQINTKLSNQ